MTEKRETINVNISTLTILKVVFVFLLIYFIYSISNILVILFVSLVLASAIDPWVDWFQKKKIPRVVGIVLIYLVVMSFIGVSIYLIIPPIISQINELSNSFPQYFEKIIGGFSYFKEYASEHGIAESIRQSLSALSTNLQSAAGGVFSTVSSIFGNIISFLLILVITFYMAAEESAMKKIIRSLVPEQHQPYAMQLTNRMQQKIGLWLRGQLILSLILFTLTLIGLTILGVKYALVLAIISGLSEFVPYLGPIIAAVPAVFLAFTQSPTLALFVVILYIVIQWSESNIIVPKIMQKVVGLNPIVSIVVLLIGFKLAGVVGAILSIPVATAASVFLKDVFEKRGSQI